MHHDSVGVETFWISPSLSRSHTLWLRLQKLEQRSRAPSRLCTLDIRGCRSQTLTLWVAHTHTHGYIPICPADRAARFPEAFLSCPSGLCCLSHQVAMSEKLHNLVTEIHRGSSNNSNFLLANWEREPAQWKFAPVFLLCVCGKVVLFFPHQKSLKNKSNFLESGPNKAWQKFVPSSPDSSSSRVRYKQMKTSLF